METVHYRASNVLLYVHSLTPTPAYDNFERHCHNYFEIIYVLKGAGSYIVEGVEYPLRPQTLILIRPNEFHFVRPLAEKYERAVIHFTQTDLIGTTALLPILKKSQDETFGIYYPAECLPTEVHTLFQELYRAPQMFSEFADPKKHLKDLLYTDLTRLLLYLSIGKPALSNPQPDALVTRTLTYINEHLTEDLNLATLSRKLITNKYYLCHTFQKHTGISIYAYITAKRIALAQQLILNGTTAAEAAYQVGYNTYSSFYRAFCKQTGKAPSGEDRKDIPDKKH